MFNINRFTKEQQEKLKTTTHIFDQYQKWIEIDSITAKKLFKEYNTITDEVIAETGCELWEVIEAESILSKDMIL